MMRLANGMPVPRAEVNRRGIIRFITSLMMGTQARPLVARTPIIQLPPELQKTMKEASKDFEVINIDLDQVTKEMARRVEGLLLYMPVNLRINSKVMDYFPNLKVISNCGVGINHIDVAAASERGIAVGNTPDVLTDCTADLAFSLLLASARNVVEGDRIARGPETKEVILLIKSKKRLYCI